MIRRALTCAPAADGVGRVGAKPAKIARRVNHRERAIRVWAAPFERPRLATLWGCCGDVLCLSPAGRDISRSLACDGDISRPRPRRPRRDAP